MIVADQRRLNPGTARPSRRRLATARDVADFLGLPMASLYDRTRVGGIPGAIRIGRRILYDLDTLEAWLDAGGDFGALSQDARAGEP